MASAARFVGPGGKTPARALRDLISASRPTEADLRLAVEWKRTETLKKTAAGVDFEGKPFAPYSRKGPYYFYPGGVANRALKRASTLRRKKALAAAKRFAKKTGGVVTDGGGIKYESYADFKRALGRSTVDLRGPRAPHMLQALVVRMLSATEAALGIYGQEAERASGHNKGTRKLPKRRFFDTSGEDLRQMGRIIGDRIMTRIKGIS